MIVIHPMSYVYLFRAGGAVKLRGCEPASPRAFPSRPTASDEMRPAEASQRRGEEIRDGILPLRAAVPNRVESPGEMRDGSRYRLTTSTGWAHGCIKRLSLDQKDSGHISPIRPSDGDHGCIKRKKRRFGAGLFPLRSPLCCFSCGCIKRGVRFQRPQWPRPQRLRAEHTEDFYMILKANFIYLAIFLIIQIWLGG